MRGRVSNAASLLWAQIHFFNVQRASILFSLQLPDGEIDHSIISSVNCGYLTLYSLSRNCVVLTLLRIHMTLTYAKSNFTWTVYNKRLAWPYCFNLFWQPLDIPPPVSQFQVRHLFHSAPFLLRSSRRVSVTWTSNRSAQIKITAH